MIDVLIIDDEPGARQHLKYLLHTHCPTVRIKGLADGFRTGIDFLKTTKVQLLFLDINLKDGTGFDLLDEFQSPDFKVIFTTAYDNFAIRAFQYHAIHYLLKPIIPEALIQSVQYFNRTAKDFQTTAQQLSALLRNVKAKEFKTITLSTQEGLFVLPLEDIIRLESEGNYTTFFSLNGDSIVVARTIKAYAELLPETLFFRIHRSHIINIRHIKGIMKGQGGYLLSSDNQHLPIARRKKEVLIKRIKENSLE
ncbi:MAG: LytTR family DNA-binding domain-containing protein [Bacteroidota bacterium]